MKTVLKVDGLFLVTQDPQAGTRYAYRDENGRHVFPADRVRSDRCSRRYPRLDANRPHAVAVRMARP